MPYPTKRMQFDGYIFNLIDNVYEPAEDSFLFAENLNIKEGQQVLDLGTGCGLLGILAAKKAASVLAVDVNPYAIDCAKENSLLNCVNNKILFLQASLFTALSPDAAFDLIMFNAPYLPSEDDEEESWIGRSWAGGKLGRKVVDQFISEVSCHLKPGGSVLLMQSTLTGLDKTLEQFKLHGLKATVKAERKLPFFETLTLIEATAK